MMLTSCFGKNAGTARYRCSSSASSTLPHQFTSSPIWQALGTPEIDTFAERREFEAHVSSAVGAELMRAREKFPVNEHELVVLSKEAGEATQALLRHGDGDASAVETASRYLHARPDASPGAVLSA